MKTNDERINDLEDQIRALKDAMNQNTRATQGTIKRLEGEIERLKSIVGLGPVIEYPDYIKRRN